MVKLVGIAYGELSIALAKLVETLILYNKSFFGLSTMDYGLRTTIFVHDFFAKIRSKRGIRLKG